MFNFVENFLCIYLDHMILILQLVNVVYHTLILQILKNLCITVINPTLSWYMILLMHCWIQFDNSLLRILYQGYWPVISFLCIFTQKTRYLSDFGIRVMLALYREFQSVPSCFWKTLRRTSINYFLNVWKNSPVRLSVLHSGLLGGFWLWTQYPG